MSHILTTFKDCGAFLDFIQTNTNEAKHLIRAVVALQSTRDANRFNPLWWKHIAAGTHTTEVVNGWNTDTNEVFEKELLGGFGAHHAANLLFPYVHAYHDSN